MPAFGGFAPYEKTVSVHYLLSEDGKWQPIYEADVRDDDVIFTAEIRANLTFAELEDLSFELTAKTVTVFPKLAPYVHGWNLLGRDSETGETVEVPAPRDGGPDQFLHLPQPLIFMLLADVRTHNMGRVDPKRLRRPDSAESSTSETSSDSP